MSSAYPHSISIPYSTCNCFCHFLSSLRTTEEPFPYHLRQTPATFDCMIGLLRRFSFKLLPVKPIPSLSYCTNIHQISSKNQSKDARKIQWQSLNDSNQSLHSIILSPDSSSDLPPVSCKFLRERHPFPEYLSRGRTGRSLPPTFPAARLLSLPLALRSHARI